ncbi:hypothetical protein D9M68_695250 [compost metagenome]
MNAVSLVVTFIPEAPAAKAIELRLPAFRNTPEFNDPSDTSATASFSLYVSHGTTFCIAVNTVVIPSNTILGLTVGVRLFT